MKTTWISDVLEGKYDGQKVELKGWVKRSRGSNKIRFLVLRDSTGSIQCVAKKDAIGEDSFDAVKSA
ncbi:MAG: OB-fold nucleic acid binding domain-containing protein, partial [Candidatus Thermoplasmatota archaeon]|nr:OB-fold nucleic acid binding domain-containing protein [Candidatus Thermoplasmatota archaeon]